MRTGAIFARGSCRALAWMLVLGVAVVLSVGEVVAQTIPNATATKIVVKPSSVDVAEGGSETFTVGLDGTLQAGATVAVTVAATLAADDDNAEFRVDASADLTTWTHTFTAPGTLGTDPPAIVDPVTVTLTALQDGNHMNGRNVLTYSTTSTQDHDNDGTTDETGFTSARLTVTEDDDDSLGVTISERTLTVLEGGSVEYTVVLDSAPTHDVMVKAEVSDEVNTDIQINGGQSDTLTFMPSDWNRKQTVTVTAVNDLNTINGTAKIKHSTTSDDVNYNKISGLRTIAVTEIDSVRTISLATSPASGMVDEGKAITITATLENPAADVSATLSSAVTVKLSGTGADKFSGTKTITIGAKSTAGSTKLTAKQDTNEDDESITLTASVSTGPTGIIEIPNNKVKLTIVDNDTYMLEADKMEVAEGGEVTLTVKLDPAAEVETKVMIDLYRASGATVMPAEGQDKDADGNAILDEGEKSAKFTLKTAKDANDANDEVIVARAMSGGKVVGDPVTINVLDTQAAPMYTLSVDPDAIGETDGEASVMVKVMTDKAVAADTTLTLAVDASSTAMDPDDYSIMPEMMEVMIEKGEDMGMTELMVTPVADAMDEANETIVLTAWMDDEQVGNAATLTIIDGDSTTFTLSGPSDMNLVEGFEYDIEVTASTPVMADTTVMIMASDASTAGDDDYMIEDIMIMAGETMGRTKLMVKSDDMPDGGTDGGMAEKLVLYGMVGNMRTNELSFYLWDLAVPALPVVAQLLLAGLMAVGGYRRYRRR